MTKIYKNTEWPTIDNYCCDEEYHPTEIIDRDMEEKNIKSKQKQWEVIDDKFIPCGAVTNELPSGYYTIEVNSTLGIHLVKQNIKTNKLYRLPNKASDIILNDIDKFWCMEETYKKYGRTYRRNYLIYSSPGTGKTSLINIMSQDLIDKYNGIIINIRNSDDIFNYINIIKDIRRVEPERRIIVTIEDIDNFISGDYGSSTQSVILNMLDGNLVTNNCVVIATTNYPERMQERFINRPSRFDLVIEFPVPNDETRKMFIEKSVLPEDLVKIDINKWVERTNGYSIDHINELILLFFVFGHTEEHAFNEVNKMVNRKGVLKNTNGKNKTIGI